MQDYATPAVNGEGNGKGGWCGKRRGVGRGLWRVHKGEMGAVERGDHAEMRVAVNEKDKRKPRGGRRGGEKGWMKIIVENVQGERGMLGRRRQGERGEVGKQELKMIFVWKGSVRGGHR